MSKQVFSVFRKELFNGKVAIVTGGGTGIGKAITQELLFLGCKVMIASRKLDRLKVTAEELRNQIPEGAPAKLELTECNIRKEDQVKNLIQTTLDRFGQLDFVVNNGGGQFPGAAETLSLKGWNAVIETNLTGTFLVCREAYNQWMCTHGGTIVNIIADMWKGWPGVSHSGAARAGVHNITMSLAVEWASSGVRINAVAPGSSIYSPTAAGQYDKSGGPVEGHGIFDVQIPRIPAKRLGTVEEVSAAVCFLLSPAAAFISGETIIIDGAQTLYTTPNPWEVPDHDRMPAYTWDKDAQIVKQQQTQQKKSKL